MNRQTQTMPLARRDKLIVSHVADETLVYDRRSSKAHCLNKTAALVWQHCDGRTSVAEITRLLAAECRAPVDEQVVWLALEQLQQSRLLQQPTPRPAGLPRPSRREMMRLSAKVAVVVLPLIVSVVAPTAVAAASAIDPSICSQRRQPNCGGDRCRGGGTCQGAGSLLQCQCF
jgi:hypothetical protein